MDPAWSHPITVAVVTGVVSGIGSTYLTNRLQHHYWTKQRAQQRKEEREFWTLQRLDEQRLDAIAKYNQLTNAYIAASVTQMGEPPPIDLWLRDINTVAGTIRNLFSRAVYEAAKQISDEIRPYATWTGLSLPERRELGDHLADLLHAALGAMYQGIGNPPPWDRG